MAGAATGDDGGSAASETIAFPLKCRGDSVASAAEPDLPTAVEQVDRLISPQEW